MNKLTAREYEVLLCLSEGLTTYETAQRLFLSAETVKSHRRKLMLKFDAKNAFHLGVIVTKSGLLDLKLKVAS